MGDWGGRGGRGFAFVKVESAALGSADRAFAVALIVREELVVGVRISPSWGSVKRRCICGGVAWLRDGS